MSVKPLYVDGGVFESQDGWTALIHAASMGHVNCVRVLIDSGAEEKSCSQFGKTALMVAAETCYTRTVCVC